MVEGPAERPAHLAIECERCQEEVEERLFVLLPACASVGIERNMDTVDVLAGYLDSFHRKGHPQYG